MPAGGAKRPDVPARRRDGRLARVGDGSLALAHPNPGSRPFQRLSRAEYARSIQELLDIDVDVSALLPPDTFSAGFDNIADAHRSRRR
jgi:hypothetical protein